MTNNYKMQFSCYQCQRKNETTLPKIKNMFWNNSVLVASEQYEYHSFKKKKMNPDH